VNSEVLIDELKSGVYEIRISRAERMNALGTTTCADLIEAITTVDQQRAKVTIFTGNGRAFCAGADLKERKGMDVASRLKHNGAINDVVNAIVTARSVTIAVLNGVALGGGLELALACDLRFAASGISLGLTESRVGACPGAGGTQRLPRLIGTSRALYMMLSGEPVTSEYALSIGLVNEVVPNDSLETRARDFAALLANRSASSLSAIKRLVYAGVDTTLDEGLRLERAALPEILSSADYAEGLAAFAERRQPRFTEIS
jgi:enoyl-CoA hydratase/carnithine racemase